MKISLRDRIIVLRRFTNRLARDVAGNTLVIVAAAIIPLVALVGSGIDMSRAYMAQSRLQMACDAASLAGRRAMTTGAVDSTVRSEALKFFRFNFETGETGKTPAFNVASFVPSVEDGTNSAVVVSASTTVPTSLMSMFGYNNIPISVTCNARQDFVNTDIVLVLDTTGSMASKAVSTDTQTKIEGIRSAVLALYDELAPAQTQLEGVGLRLRYGIVPYSLKVNVGKLIRAKSTSYMVSNWTYQSRRPWYFSNTPITTSTCYQTAGNNTCFSTAGSAQTTGTYNNLSSNNCNKYGNNTYSGGSGSPEYLSDNKKVTYSGLGETNNRCVRQAVTTTHNTTNSAASGYSFERWEYLPMSYDVSSYLGGGAVTTPSDIDGSTSTWDGCIEERDTDSSIDSSSTAVDPSVAHDLNIDEIPTNDSTKWRPSWTDVIYTRASTANSYTGSAIGGGDLSACPTQAKQLQSWTKSDLSTYLNTLVAKGYTYHDIGMIWGAHFISSAGIFGGDNPTTYKNMPVAKYVIYMTDGQLDTEPLGYSAYGVEKLDQRVTGTYVSSTDLDNRHKKRFSLACDAAKSAGANIWVIVFASSLSTELTNCASKSTQAKVSASSTALIQDFAKIGKEIGALRLTK